MIFRNSDAKYIFDYLYHRAYLPSIGLIIVLAELLKRLALRNERYFQRIAIGAVPFLAYCAIASFHTCHAEASVGGSTISSPLSVSSPESFRGSFRM